MMNLFARIATVPTVLFALATSAHADSESQGWSWSKANDNFGAYLEIDTSVNATSYGELCADAREAEAICDTLPNDLKSVCKQMATPIAQEYCKVNSGALYFDVQGSANADAKLFSKKVQVAGMKAWGRVDAVSPQVGVALYALGQRIGGITRNASYSTMLLMPLPSIASEAKFMAGPVPIYAEAGVFGAMGANLEATLTSAGVVLSATPFAGAEIEVGAGVGNDLASVGIRGKLNLIEIEVPSEASVTLGNNGQVNYEMDTSLDIEALDGSIALVVKLVGEEIATLTLCSWDSYYDRSWSLAHEEGSFSL